MDIDTLRQQSIRLFNLTLLFIAINLISFMATVFYFYSSISKIKSLKESDPQSYAEQAQQIQLLSLFGLAIALGSAFVCAYLVLKRSKIVVKLQDTELNELKL